MSEELSKKLEKLGPALRHEKGAMVLDVVVIPHAPKSEIGGFRNGRLLIKVTAAPEKGKANDAVLQLVAEYLDVAPSKLSVIRGQTARNKGILLQNMA